MIRSGPQTKELIFSVLDEDRLRTLLPRPMSDILPREVEEGHFLYHLLEVIALAVHQDDLIVAAKYREKSHSS